MASVQCTITVTHVNLWWATGNRTDS